MNTRHNILKGIALAAVLTAAVPVSAENVNRPGWQYLMRNAPDSAAMVFSRNTRHASPPVAAEAYRGLGQTAMFESNVSEATNAFLNSWKKDGNTALLMGSFGNLVYFREQPDPGSVIDGYKTMERLAEEPGIFAGQFISNMLNRHLNDGNYKQAQKYNRALAPLTEWRMIGPFNNISAAGYDTEYPPEHELDFTGEYGGKDGNRVRWHPISCRSLSGWVFTENHCPSADAVLYFYCTVNSDRAQRGNLAFGASGTFKIFLNGTEILRNEEFRNTGCDVFMQQVELNAGDNPLLIKIGHEKPNPLVQSAQHSNFMIRFTDEKYRPLQGIRVHTQPAAPLSKAAPPANRCPSPLTDTVITVLSDRITADPGDMDAALLLMNFYNVMEMADAGQILAKTYLREYPGSALWHSLYAESLLRAKKTTDGERELKTAYRCSPRLYEAWLSELTSLQSTADARQVLAFIQAAPPYFRSRTQPLLSSINANFKTGNKSAALSDIAVLELKCAGTQQGMTALVGWWLEQGKPGHAEKLVNTFLKNARRNVTAYETAAKIALQQGNFKKAVRYLEKGRRAVPDNQVLPYTLADLHFRAGKYRKADGYLNDLFTIMPYHASGLLLLGNVKSELGKPAEAEAAFKQAIDYTRNDLAAWENLYRLQNAPALESLAPLPDVKELIEKSRGWKYREEPQGAILGYNLDVFYYPSHCSRKRIFITCYLPTQKAIDAWKERTIHYNSHFQSFNITRAHSLKDDGTQINADINRNEIVFKSLEPGDYTVLEYTLDNYYTGTMAGQVWGRTYFNSSTPVFADHLRLITPRNDTIPYTVYGDSTEVNVTTAHGYRITDINRPAYKEPARETCMLNEWPGISKATYGTLENWSGIVAWYDDLTRHKQKESLELKAVADSLFGDAGTDREKVRRMHAFVTGSIRYSSIPFRQSGWVPQAAHEVLATRIGDCKDMSCLGRSLLRLGGIESSLVLVNTRISHFTGCQGVSPSFNHCILVCHLDDGDLFTDLTDNTLSLGTLPKSDQNAMALVIREGTDSLITLPADTLGERYYGREIALAVHADGSVTGELHADATGWFARNIRGAYRYQSDKDRTAGLHKYVNEFFPGMNIDSVTMYGLTTLEDSSGYDLHFTVPQYVTLAGKTAIMPLKTPGSITGEMYPAEEKRNYPVDMDYTWFSLSRQRTESVITYPADWSIISVPESKTLKSPYGTFTLSVETAGGRICIIRQAEFNFDRYLGKEEYPAMSEFLDGVALADNIQIVFNMQ